MTDNWEGDRDLDEYKGQDWRGAVFNGAHGHDGKYRGVGKYGSSSSSNYGSGSLGGNYSRGSSYSGTNWSSGNYSYKKNRSWAKIGGVLAILVFVAVGGLAYYDYTGGELADITIPNIEISDIEIPTTETIQKGFAPRPAGELFKTLKINEEGGIPNHGWVQKTLDEKTVVMSSADGKINFQYFVPQNHCGDVKVHVLLNDKEVSPTRWMGNYQNNQNIPLNSGIIQLDVKPSTTYAVSFYPEGRAGGCGDGYVYSWFGTVEFYR